MKGMRKLSAILLAVMLCVGIISIPVFAATISQDGLEVTLTTDKTEYKIGEEVKATLTVKNTNKVAVSNVSLENIIPKGYKLADDSVAMKQVETLEADESATLTVTYVAETSTGNGEEGEDKSGTGENKQDTAEGNKPENDQNNGHINAERPSTGDESNVVFWIILMALAVLIITVVVIKDKKNGKKLLSLFLCLTMIGSIIGGVPMQVKAAESEAKNLTVKETIKIGDRKVEMSATVKYELPDLTADTDSDDISDEFEDLLGTDSNLDDTDGDGLSDYEEVFLTGSDPAEADSDGNGVNDGQEDFDSDGIINLDEVKIGTDANKADSDGDGLNDYDEVNVYNTNPIKSDTDDDTISDGDEILLGLDPLTASTDGKILDSERLFEQELQDEYIEDSLKEDNSLVPVINGNVTGNINKHVELKEADVSALDDNRVVIGKQVDVKTDYVQGTDLRLSFENKEDTDRFGFYIICQYIDGEIVPCETVSEDNSIWTTVEEGTYFVVDAEMLLIDLDIPIEKYKDTSTMTMASEEIAMKSMVEAPSNEVSDNWYNENYVIVDKNNNIVEKAQEDSQSPDISADESSVSGIENTDTTTSTPDAKSEENTESGQDIKNNSTVEKTQKDSQSPDNSANESTVSEIENTDTAASTPDVKSEGNILNAELNNGEHFILSSALNQPNTLAAKNRAGQISGQADIVFVIDTTGSMSDAINNVVSNIDSFVDTLQSEYSVKANFALIDYKDITCGENTTLIQNGSSAWFSDVSSFKSKINGLIVDGGGDGPETPIDGLAMAQKLDFRQNANKFVILVTDADYKNDNNYGIASMDEMEKVLEDSGIVTSVISSNFYESLYHNLYTNTGGVFGNIYGDFKSVLLQLADNIGEIVNDGSWVLLSDYQFIKLKQPLDEKGGNSDEDDILDEDELGEKTVSDVKPYIDWVLKKYNIPEGMYDDPTTVNVYKYKSNPILADTDFDGVTDDKDSEPKNGKFKGKLLGYYDVANADYTMDYRDFFNSNDKYSEKLCSSSLTFANTIYNDCGFSYSTSGKKITNIKELMKYHGFESIIDYQLAKGYNENGISVPAYKDDDISEIGIGYHTVNYKGKTKTVLGIVIRGTNGTIEEWSSNFDMGNPAEWKSEYHKGFLKTEERIEYFVNQYVNVFLSDKANLVYWITGHSRGAALANILAAKLVDAGNNVFAYTFATPSTTISSSKNSSKYNCIFNFANTSDFVTYVPLKEWDFGRFGITKNLSIEDASLEKEWCSQTGLSKYNAMNKNVITLATSRIAKSCSKTWDEVYDYAGSQDIDDSQYGCISKRAKRYCRLEERNGIFGGHKGYKLYPTTAFIFQLGAEMLAGSDKEKENVKTIIPELWNSKYTGVIIFFLGDAIGNRDSFKNMELGESLIGDGHAPATYYVLTH